MIAPVQILVLIGWLLLSAACLAAWRWGGKPERQGALLILAVTLVFSVAGFIPDKALMRGVYLALDGALAVGLLLLALRHAAGWLGVAVLLQGVQFSLHAYYLVAERRYDQLYATVNNLVTLGVLCSLLVGAIWANRRAAK